MDGLNLIMPMAGGGTRFANQEFNLPKPLIEIYDKPFFYWATQSITKFVDVASLTFVVLNEHIQKFNIDKRIREYYPAASIEVIPHVLQGAVLTCMQGIKTTPDNTPILFNDCDHLFLCNLFYDFCKKNRFQEVDGALLTFASKDAKYSYVAYGNDGNVNRTAEKEVISNDAICGAYYFKNKDVFSNSAKIYLKNCSYNEYFISGIYNTMIIQNKKVCTFRTSKHVSFGTPEEYEKAKVNDTYKMLIDN